MLAATPVFAATVKSIALKDAGKGTQVVVESDAAINYHDFTLESPDRIVLDCPGANLAFTERTWAGREGSNVKSVRATEMGWGKETGTRIVVDLASAASYGVSQVGNNIVVAVESGASAPDDNVVSTPSRASSNSDANDVPDGRRMSLDVQ